MKDGHPQEPGRRLNRLRGRGKAAAGAVGSDGIVFAPPLLDQHGRQLARIGANLNQIARWANIFKANTEAVEVVAHLVAIERALAALAPGGRVTGGSRVDGRRDLFKMTVRPDSDGDVTITLPAGRECGVSGAICTKGENRRQLTNSPSPTVRGPSGSLPAHAPMEEDLAARACSALAGGDGRGVVGGRRSRQGPARRPRQFGHENGRYDLGLGLRGRHRRPAE